MEKYSATTQRVFEEALQYLKDELAPDALAAVTTLFAEEEATADSIERALQKQVPAEQRRDH